MFIFTKHSYNIISIHKIVFTLLLLLQSFVIECLLPAVVVVSFLSVFIIIINIIFKICNLFIIILLLLLLFLLSIFHYSLLFIISFSFFLSLVFLSFSLVLYSFLNCIFVLFLRM